MSPFLSALTGQAQAYAAEIVITVLFAAAGAVWRATKRGVLNEAAALRARAAAAEAAERERGLTLQRLGAIAAGAALDLLATIQDDPAAAEAIAAAEAKVSAGLADTVRDTVVRMGWDEAGVRNLVLRKAQEVVEERARAAISGGQDPAAVTGALAGALARLRGVAG